MQLKSIETFTNQDVGFVRVTAEDGSQGCRKEEEERSFSTAVQQQHIY